MPRFRRLLARVESGATTTTAAADHLREAGTLGDLGLGLDVGVSAEALRQCVPAEPHELCFPELPTLSQFGYNVVTATAEHHEAIMVWMAEDVMHACVLRDVALAELTHLVGPARGLKQLAAVIALVPLQPPFAGIRACRRAAVADEFRVAHRAYARLPWFPPGTEIAKASRTRSPGEYGAACLTTSWLELHPTPDNLPRT
jgi:hypothetical protein